MALICDYTVEDGFKMVLRSPDDLKRPKRMDDVSNPPFTAGIRTNATRAAYDRLKRLRAFNASFRIRIPARKNVARHGTTSVVLSSRSASVLQVPSADVSTVRRRASSALRSVFKTSSYGTVSATWTERTSFNNRSQGALVKVSLRNATQPCARKAERHHGAFGCRVPVEVAAIKDFELPAWIVSSVTRSRRRKRVELSLRRIANRTSISSSNVDIDTSDNSAAHAPPSEGTRLPASPVGNQEGECEAKLLPDVSFSEGSDDEIEANAVELELASQDVSDMVDESQTVIRQPNQECESVAYSSFEDSQSPGSSIDNFSGPAPSIASRSPDAERSSSRQPRLDDLPKSSGSPDPQRDFSPLHLSLAEYERTLSPDILNDSLVLAGANIGRPPATSVTIHPYGPSPIDQAFALAFESALTSSGYAVNPSGSHVEGPPLPLPTVIHELSPNMFSLEHAPNVTFGRSTVVTHDTLADRSVGSSNTVARSPTSVIPTTTYSIPAREADQPTPSPSRSLCDTRSPATPSTAPLDAFLTNLSEPLPHLLGVFESMGFKSDHRIDVLSLTPDIWPMVAAEIQAKSNLSDWSLVKEGLEARAKRLGKAPQSIWT
ncbi:unnamed protein product [Somion occarium]|uniref:Uncharacterized protein n=1 Tax=Somion occarium TaxID=3059160 RepID=A0ABP1CG34_9APHY